MLRIYTAEGLPSSSTDEIIKSSEYFLGLCPAIGRLAVSAYPDIDLRAIERSYDSGSYQEIIRFNQLSDNIEAIHLFAPSETTLQKSKGLAIGNLAIINPDPSEIWQTVIHELGHIAGLVQPGMRQHYPVSEITTSRRLGNHCIGPFCIMSTRRIEPELRVGRYSDFREKPGEVFCNDCQKHLSTVQLEDMPWYNQIRELAG